MLTRSRLHAVRFRDVFILLSLLAPLLLMGCNRNISMDKSVHNVVADLAHQLAREPQQEKTLVIDAVIDRRSGQQTEGSLALQQALEEQLGAQLSGVVIVPFGSESLSAADLLLSGSLTATSQQSQYRMSVALTDTNSGVVVAQAGGYFEDALLSRQPTPFYVDIPAVAVDRPLKGLIETSETSRGDMADAVYFEQVSTSALLSEALREYNAGRFKPALVLYLKAYQREDGKQFRTFSGLYACNVRLGHLDAAEKAFEKIVAFGLATGDLSVKLLFRPGTTEFWSRSRDSQLYSMWLRRIARAARDTGNCLRVVGHTSSSGTDEVNAELSVQRASVIRDRLLQHTVVLKDRLRVSGVGAAENIVGTGVDDDSDAVDRRVEFRVESCTGGAVLANAGDGPGALARRGEAGEDGEDSGFFEQLGQTLGVFSDAKDAAEDVAKQARGVTDATGKLKDARSALGAAEEMTSKADRTLKAAGKVSKALETDASGALKAAEGVTGSLKKANAVAGALKKGTSKARGVLSEAERAQEALKDAARAVDK